MKRLMMVLLAVLMCGSLAFFACGDGDGGKDPGGKTPGGEGPGEIVDPGEGILGNWDWSVADDHKPNATVTVAIPKPPYLGTAGASANGGAYKAEEEFTQNNFGGTSTINGTPDAENTEIIRPETAKVIGQDGTEVTAFHFTGTVQVSKNNRPATEGAWYPQVGWEAIPDEDTLAELQRAWAYSFWIKVESCGIKRSPTTAAKSLWIFKTVACAEGFAFEQGHEFKHYFGNAPAPLALTDGEAVSRARYTKNLAVGEWHRITVILDPEREDFNMDQDGHIHQWNLRFLAAFDPTTATKLQWQIALQDQDGITQRAGTYDIAQGEFAYDVYFYGLELHLPE